MQSGFQSTIDSKHSLLFARIYLPIQMPPAFLVQPLHHHESLRHRGVLQVRWLKGRDLPQEGGPEPHGGSQDQQLAGPGTAVLAHEQAAHHRRDWRGAARRGNGDVLYTIKGQSYCTFYTSPPSYFLAQRVLP